VWVKPKTKKKKTCVDYRDSCWSKRQVYIINITYNPKYSNSERWLIYKQEWKYMFFLFWKIIYKWNIYNIIVIIFV